MAGKLSARRFLPCDPRSDHDPSPGRGAFERWHLILECYEIEHFDASDLMIDRNRAAVEIPFIYRHKETGAPLETVKANF